MSVLAPGVRDRSFKTVLRGFDRAGVRAALDAAASAFEALEADIDALRRRQAEAVREIDRITGLERSLVRSCVAAEEDARIRCGAARRYATRVIGAAEEQSAARAAGPARERDRLARELDALVDQRRRAAEALEALITDLQVTEAGAPVEEHAEHAHGDQGHQRADEQVLTTAAAATVPAATVEGVAPVVEQPMMSPPWPTTRTPESVAATAAVTLPSVPSADTGASAASARVVPVAAAIEAVPADDSRRTPAEPETEVPAAHHEHGQARHRLRVALVMGSAALVLLLLQGTAGAPPSGGGAPVISAAGMAPTAAPQAAPTAPAAGTTPAAPPLVLRLRPLRTCWARVVVDDRTDARELQPGEDILLTAQHAIVLRVGDAGAMSIELNGRVLPPLGQDGQVVERRFTAGSAPE